MLSFSGSIVVWLEEYHPDAATLELQCSNVNAPHPVHPISPSIHANVYILGIIDLKYGCYIFSFLLVTSWQQESIKVSPI